MKESVFEGMKYVNLKTTIISAVPNYFGSKHQNSLLGQDRMPNMVINAAKNEVHVGEQRI